MLFSGRFRFQDDGEFAKQVWSIMVHASPKTSAKASANIVFLDVLSLTVY